MLLLPMSKLGASEPTPGVLSFGIFLPAVSPGVAAAVRACVITEADAMRTGIAPVSVAMTHSADPTYGDHWSATLTLSSYLPAAPSTWGASGTYLYWYQVVLPSGAVIDWLARTPRRSTALPR